MHVATLVSTPALGWRMCCVRCVSLIVASYEGVVVIVQLNATQHPGSDLGRTLLPSNVYTPSMGTQVNNR